MLRRPDDRANVGPNSKWNTILKGRQLGDASAFVRAANARTHELREDAKKRQKNLAKNKAAWACSFVHLVLSPSNRTKYSDEDLKRLAEPWIRDADGLVVPHVGAIHRENGGHLHLAVARDKFSRDELANLKARSNALALDLELGMEMARGRETQRTLEQALKQETGLARPPGLQRGGIIDELSL